MLLYNGIFSRPNKQGQQNLYLGKICFDIEVEISATFLNIYRVSSATKKWKLNLVSHLENNLRQNIRVIKLD